MILVRNRAKDAVLETRVLDCNRRISAREFMVQRLKLKELGAEGSLSGTELESHTTVARLNTPFGRRDTRVSVVYFKDKAFVFFGAAKSDRAFNRADPLFLSTARSLRALAPDETRLAQGLRIEVIKPAGSETFAALAKDSPVPNYPEQILRLINNKYPQGEPEPGRELKIIR